MEKGTRIHHGSSCGVLHSEISRRESCCEAESELACSKSVVLKSDVYSRGDVTEGEMFKIKLFLKAVCASFLLPAVSELFFFITNV